MDLSNQEEVEARLGDMMGFTKFGAQPDAKKRKTSNDGPVMATSSSTHLSASTPLRTDLHAHPLTHNPAQLQGQPSQATGSASAMAGGSGSPTTEQPKHAFPTGVPMEIFDKLTWKELEAYRKGVKKENGDLAWFLPSFIEDPWAKLEKSGTGVGAP